MSTNSIINNLVIPNLINCVKNLVIYNSGNVKDLEIEYLYISEFKKHFLVLYTNDTNVILKLLSSNLSIALNTFYQYEQRIEYLLRFCEMFINRQLKDLNNYLLFFE
jgi:hypothetical protein